MRKIGLILFMACIVALSSCVKDRDNGSERGKAEENEVLFTLTTSGKFDAGLTRAQLPQADENMISSVTIVVFGADGVYDYYKSSTGITTVANNASVKVKLRTDGGAYDILVLTNLSDYFTDAQIITALSGSTIDNVYKKLRMPVLTSTVWGETKFVMSGVLKNQTLSKNTSTIGAIPLIRSLASVDVGLNWQLDVNNDGRWHGLDNFELQEVYIYNANADYTVLPKITAYVDNTYKRVNTPTIYKFSTSTTDEATSIGNTGISALHYNSGNITIAGTALNNTGNGQHISSRIYMSEVNNIGVVESLDQPGLVVKGKYNGVEYYYRIDFTDKFPNGTFKSFLSILRNHKYRFNIVKVSGPGQLTPDEAFATKSINIVLDITSWDEGAVGDIIYDGQFQLTVSPGSIVEFDKDSGNKILNIYADAPGGWKAMRIEYLDGSDWLSLDIENGGNFTPFPADGTSGGDVKVDTRVRFNVTNNDSGAPRTARLHIKSGNLSHTIKVVQSNVVSNLLVVENATGVAIDAIEFAAANSIAPGEQKYRVKWSPKAETLYISLAPVANPAGGVYEPLKWVHYNTESGAIDNNATTIYTSPIDNQTGDVEFTIKPTPITHGVDGVNLTTDPFYERSQQINFRATGSDGIMRKSVILQQVVMNAVTKSEASYRANGSDYTFNVKSNRPWRAYFVDNGHGMITSPTVNITTPFATGGYNLPDGTNVKFTTFNDFSNPTKIEGTGKVRIEFMDNLGNWIAIKQTELFCVSGNPQKLSNTYIVAPNSDPILIPVKRANGYGVDKNGTEFLQDDWALGDQIKGAHSADLVWTDQPHNATPGSIKSLGDNGAVKMIATSGNDDARHILVMPGSGNGNAVVSAKVGGKIVWSWHIWVTEQLKSDGFAADNSNKGSVWMDRNLGATTNTYITTSPSTLGLNYQWGRKDPMPSAAAHEQPHHAPGDLYYLGDNTSDSTVRWEEGTGTLSESILNPLMSCRSWRGSNANASWITGYKNVYDTGDKTIYDPCPDGWRVPVRINKSNTESTHHWGNESELVDKWDGYNGISWETKGGYYPAAGTRYLSTVGFALVGYYGYYWSASPHYNVNGSYIDSGFCLLFTKGGHFYPNGRNNRYDSGSVRCVAEQP